MEAPGAVSRRPWSPQPRIALSPRMFLSGPNTCCFATRLILHAFRHDAASAGPSASAAHCGCFPGPRRLPRPGSMGSRGDPSRQPAEGRAGAPSRDLLTVRASRKCSRWFRSLCGDLSSTLRSLPRPGVSRAWWGGQPCTQSVGAERPWGCSWLLKPSLCGWHLPGCEARSSGRPSGRAVPSLSPD